MTLSLKNLSSNKHTQIVNSVIHKHKFLGSGYDAMPHPIVQL